MDPSFLATRLAYIFENYRGTLGYNLKLKLKLILLHSNLSLQPLMLIVPDVQDVYTPLQTDVIVQLSEVGAAKF